VIDRIQGNLLKLDYNRAIIKAFHGSRALEFSEIEFIYGNSRSIDLESPIDFIVLATYFETPVASLFVSLVDHIDKNVSKQQQAKYDGNMSIKNYSSHVQKIFEAMTYNFNQWDRGWYFKSIASQPEKYIITQPNVRKWLLELKEKHHRVLFLLTNSLPEYTHLLMRFSFGEDWFKLFDVVSVTARKPHFFTECNEYYQFCLVHSDPNDYPGPQFPLFTKPITLLKPNRTIPIRDEEQNQSRDSNFDEKDQPSSRKKG